MAGKEGCHLIVGDLPYGVQHAPKDGRKISSLRGLMEEALPAYYAALKAGGTIALSFNAYTLSRDDAAQMMRSAGFNVQTHPPYHDFSHWVEQAVNRDFVVARKERSFTTNR
jgi:tRNA G10  N-methylase Trm11